MTLNVTAKPTPTFPLVPLIEVNDPVLGGIDGASNKSALSLAERTDFLRMKGINEHDVSFTYPINCFVQVAGVVYKSKSTNTNKPPAANPTIWERCYLTAAEAFSSTSLTDIPTAPTAPAGTNTTQLASTAFVQQAVGGAISKTILGVTTTISDVEAANAYISFFGALNADAIVIFPTAIQRIYSIGNFTTGNFKLTVKTASGTGIDIEQNTRNMVINGGAGVFEAYTPRERTMVVSSDLTKAAYAWSAAGSASIVNGQQITSSSTTITNPSATRPMLVMVRILSVRASGTGITTLVGNNMQATIYRQNGTTIIAQGFAPKIPVANQAFDIAGLIEGSYVPFVLAPGASETLTMKYTALTVGTLVYAAGDAAFEAYASFMGITQ